MSHIDASLAGVGLPRAERAQARNRFWLLTVGSIGVVYGDIGTSPLYALREAINAAVGADGDADPRRGAGRAVADPLGADRHRHAEIRRHPAARRQQRRGRHAGADGAGATRAGTQRRRGGAARHHQRRAVLRRRRAHAGAVGALRDRRPEDRDAGVRALRRAAHRRDPDRAVRRAVARHRAGSRPSSARSRWSGSSSSAWPASGTSPPTRACSPRSIRSTARASSPATG